MRRKMRVEKENTRNGRVRKRENDGVKEEGTGEAGKGRR